MKPRAPVGRHRMSGNPPGQATTGIPDMSHADWLLVLLGADNGRPVRGRTVFVKEMFVIGKEVVQQVDEKFDFFPSRYGPYSAFFQPNLDALVSRKLVHEEEAVGLSRQFGGEARMDYSLTPNGSEAAAALRARLPAAIAARVDEYKRTLSSLGFWGLIRYVYSAYPEYTIASELKAP